MRIKKSTTNFNVDKLPKLVNSLTDILNDSLPKSAYGLLSTAQQVGDDMLFGNRWLIVPVAKANYNVVDNLNGNMVCLGLARLQTAISIITLLHKNPDANITRIKILQSVDQGYLRCLTDIYTYKLIIKQTQDLDKRTMIQYRLDDKLYKLNEIKQQLFKLYC
jgi:hypothetical protein